MNNIKSHYLQLDMAKSEEFRTISIWQGENKSNQLEMDLTHQFQSFNPTVTKTIILYDNEHGVPIVQSNATYANGKVSCTIPDGVYQSVGRVRGQISLYNGEVKTQSGVFFIEVRQSVGIEAMAGKPEWGELDKAFEIAEKAEEWKVQEEQRKTNELDRVKKENDRNTAEAGRKSAESGRVSAESGRVSAESTRVNQESGRVTSFNNIKKQYEDALALGNADVAIVDVRSQLETIEQNKVNKNAFVNFIFDDGYQDNELTYNIFKTYGMVCNFALVGNRLYNADVLSLNKLLAYHKEGFEIISHSYYHKDYRNTGGETPTTSELEQDYGKSRELFNKLGVSASTLVVPFSSAKSYCLDEARKYYDLIALGGSGFNDEKTFKNKIITRVSLYSSGVAGAKALIDKAILEKSLLCFYDHRTGQAGSMSESDLREVLTYLRTKVSGNLCTVANISECVIKRLGHVCDNSKKGTYVQKNLFDKFVLNDSESVGCVLADKTLNGVNYQEISLPSTMTLTNKVSLDFTLKSGNFAYNGEVITLFLKLAGSNSQAYRVNCEIQADIRKSDESTLFKINKQYTKLNVIDYDLDLRLYNEAGININDIDNIKISLVFTISELLTATQRISLKNVVIGYGAKPNFANEQFSGVSSKRPLNGLYVGSTFFDTSLSKPIWCKSTYPIVWVDSTGTIV